MKGSLLIKALKHKFNVKTDASIQSITGLSIQTIQNWKNTPKNITPKLVSNLIKSTIKQTESKFSKSSIRPVVEFHKIEKNLNSRARNYSLFTVKEKASPYNIGLYKALNSSKGVYIFSDSRGNAIYVGKATKNLWVEANLAFNRNRGSVQKIRRVKHPQKKSFQPYDELQRHIDEYPVPLHEIAVYFSAYEITLPEMISEIECLLVRSFANDILNVRMERFYVSKEKK